MIKYNAIIDFLSISWYNKKIENRRNYGDSLVNKRNSHVKHKLPLGLAKCGE